MARSNLCACGACRHIGDLDLKAVVHRGPVSAYRLGRFVELSGLPVVVVHRLLKNGVRRPRYLLVTRDARDFAPAFAGPAEHRVEDCRDVGEIDCAVHTVERDALTSLDQPPEPARPVAEQAAKVAANLRWLGRALTRRPTA